MLYASYGHGTKTGGYVETNTNAYPVFADPAADSLIKSETAQTIEVGAKSTLFDRSLRLNASLFHTKISNFQDTVFTGAAAGFITENRPAKTQGVEFESVWQATKALRLAAAATYADATATISAQDLLLVPTITCHECRATQSPTWSGTADANYEYSLTSWLNGTASAHFRYRGSMFNQDGDAFPTGPYRPIDLSLGVESADGKWSVIGMVKNVNNSLSEDFASPSVDPRFASLASPAPLRTVWLTAAIHF
jgi:iron complex outermembrane receptor protein